MTVAMAVILSSLGCVIHALITKDRNSVLGGAIVTGAIAAATFLVWLLTEKVF